MKKKKKMGPLQEKKKKKIPNKQIGTNGTTSGKKSKNPTHEGKKKWNHFRKKKWNKGDHFKKKKKKATKANQTKH
jgi:hypothetical protein